jgi:putative acetyltransferase
MIEIRQEQPQDRDAIQRLNRAAFADGPEAALVDRLRSRCQGYLGFVAVDQSDLVGQLLFTPVTIDGSPVVGMGLAPMAVSPSRQRQGIGSELVRHGLAFLRQAQCPFVIVLGHPQYYPRFGFEPASKQRLRSQWPAVPDEVFMIKVLNPEAMPKQGGVARYREEFNDAI